jgi:RNA recognition motif-containing protein
MNIYVGNIPRETTEDEIRAAFAQYGEVITVNLVKDRYTNTLKGFGFVEMPQKGEAESSIKGLDGTMFNGRPLTVNQAKPKTTTQTNDRPRRYNTGY